MNVITPIQNTNNIRMADFVRVTTASATYRFATTPTAFTIPAVDAQPFDALGSLVKINDVLSENRIIKIKLYAPFSKLSKYDELNILRELDGNLNLTLFTLTCYNPNEHGQSCGECPSCSERIANFAKINHKDTIEYSKDIPWDKLLKAA